MKKLLLLAGLAVSAFAQTTEVYWQYWNNPCNDPRLAAVIPLCNGAERTPATVMVNVLPVSNDIVSFTITVEYTDAEGKQLSTTKAFNRERTPSSAWTNCHFTELKDVKVRKVTVVSTGIVSTDN